MVAVATEIKHEQNFKANDQLEIVIGMDKIVRINIDGICALRVRLKSLEDLVLVDGSGDTHGVDPANGRF